MVSSIVVGQGAVYYATPHCVQRSQDPNMHRGILHLYRDCRSLEERELVVVSDPGSGRWHVCAWCEYRAARRPLDGFKDVTRA